MGRKQVDGAGILTCQDGASIAYSVKSGKSPSVIFMHGFRSDQNGEKALDLNEYCAQIGHTCVRYDAFGHGASSGHYTQGTIGRWAADAIEVIDRLTEGPVVLVGSSYGGWIAVLAALARPERVAGLVGIAAAPDFTRDMMEREFSDEQRRQIREDGQVVIPNCYAPDDPWIIPRLLIDEAESNLVLTGPIAITCPVRLIHGQQDEDVPWQTSLALADRITGTDVETLLIKDAGHRLSRPQDLAHIRQVVGALLA